MKTIEKDFWLFWGESPEGTPKREKGEAVLGFILKAVEKDRSKDRKILDKVVSLYGSPRCVHLGHHHRQYHNSDQECPVEKKINELLKK